MTTIRMTEAFTTCDGRANLVTFETGEQIRVFDKTGTFWWTSTSATEAYLIPDWACEVVPTVAS